MEMLKKKIVSSTPYFVCCLRPSDDNNKVGVAGDVFILQLASPTCRIL